MSDGKVSGVGHRTLQITKQLIKSDCIDLHFFGCLPDRFAEREKLTEIPLNDHYTLEKLWRVHFGTALRARQYDLDVLHCPKSLIPFGFSGLMSSTIHDVIFMKYPDQYSRFWRWYWIPALRYSLSRSDRIVTVSRTTKKDLVHFFDVSPEEVVVIPNGVDLDLFTDERGSNEEEYLNTRYGIKKPYCFYLGDWKRRKNLPRLLEAFAQLSEDSERVDLVMAGNPTRNQESILRIVEKLDLRSRLQFPGYIEEQDLPKLYRQADFLVYPPLAEGFGIPVLQALACGCPVVCSGIPAIRELAGDVPEYFDPTDVQSIKNSLADGLSGLSRPTNRGRKLAQKYSWSKIGDKYVEVFRGMR